MGLADLIMDLILGLSIARLIIMGCGHGLIMGLMHLIMDLIMGRFIIMGCIMDLVMGCIIARSTIMDLFMGRIMACSTDRIYNGFLAWSACSLMGLGKSPVVSQLFSDGLVMLVRRHANIIQQAQLLDRFYFFLRADIMALYA